MKQRFLILVIGIFVCAAGLWADPPDRVGRLNFVSGTVSFQVGGVYEWVPAVLNYPLVAGDELWADNGGRSEIHVGSTAIRMDSRTDLSFVSLDDQIVQLRLVEGSVAMRVRELDAGETIEVDTPNTSVSLQSPGSYRIDVSEDGDTTVSVWSGDSRVAIGASTLSLTSGQAALVSGTGIPTITMQSIRQRGDWDLWYMARDQREDRLVSVRYVPRNLIGCEDLDYYGDWQVINGYGPVWIPSGVSAAWAPYRFGHWAWVQPWGWTWIDDAPWGFAPFHYGRWAFVGNRWVWLPGAINVRPVYAPALVVFGGGDDWILSGGIGIGWFPLGPHEVYVPSYSASSAYVRRVNVGHVTNIDVTHIDKERITYVNRSLPRAVTVVPRDSFARSEPVERALVSVSERDIMKAPVGGTSASIAPRTAQSSPVKTPASQPPARILDKSRAVRVTPQQTAPEQPRATVVPQGPREPASTQSQSEKGKVQPQVQATQGRGSGVVTNDRSRAEATALIASVRQRISQADARASAARNANATRQLAGAKSLLADAERNLAAGNYAAATQKANAAQSTLDQVERLLSSGNTSKR